MEGCLTWVLVLILDFLFTALCWWLICLVLSAFGLVWLWSWSAAFGFWVICKILKLIF